MSATTPRYKLTYPTADDYVDDAPQQFENMCESIEDALYLVDQRSLPGSIKPVIANTREQLYEITGTPGQIAVINDPTGGEGGYDFRSFYWSPSKNKWIDIANLSDVQTESYFHDEIVSDQTFPELSVSGWRNGPSCTIQIFGDDLLIPVSGSPIGHTTPSGRPYKDVRQLVAIQDGKWGWLEVGQDGTIKLVGQYGDLNVSEIYATITYTAGQTNQTPDFDA